MTGNHFMNKTFYKHIVVNIIAGENCKISIYVINDKKKYIVIFKNPRDKSKATHFVQTDKRHYA